MKKIVSFLVLLFTLFVFLNNGYANDNSVNSDKNQVNICYEDLEQFTELEKQIRSDFKIFLEDLHSEREKVKRESLLITRNMVDILEKTSTLINDSRKDIKDIVYNESRILLIASVFLWVSVTVFIVVNLVFASNLRKELFFLRNSLLRSEIKDNIIALSEKLVELDKKLELLQEKK